MIFTPRSRARSYGAAPAKAGRNEWWMFITGAPTRSRNEPVRICMYRASTTRSNRPARTPSIASSAASRWSREFGTCTNGTPKRSTSSRASSWFDTTTSTSANSSPLRRRQSRSSRQCSSRLTRIATRFGTEASVKVAVIPNGPATVVAKRSRIASSGPSCSNSIRIRNRPPIGSVECCADDVMFAPAAWRNDATAATIPGRSGHATRRRPCTRP